MPTGVWMADAFDENRIKKLPICPSFLTFCELAVRHIQPYAVQTRLGA